MWSSSNGTIPISEVELCGPPDVVELQLPGALARIMNYEECWDSQFDNIWKTAQIRENVQQAYWELKKEMSNLHLVTEVQTEMLKKLKLIPLGTKRVSSYTPLQCTEDLEKDTANLHLADSGAVCKKRLLLPSDQIFSNSASSPSYTGEKPIPVCDSTFQEHNSYGKSSLEDNSWVFPSPPKPSETVFWEMKNKVCHLNFPENSLDQCNQNCLHKS